MKKYMLLGVGYEPITPEIQQAWGAWFGSLSDRIIDGGNPFGNAREVRPDGVTELPLDKNAITGYTIISAENMEEAVAVAQSAPLITSMIVLEANSM